MLLNPSLSLTHNFPIPYPIFHYLLHLPSVTFFLIHPLLFTPNTSITLFLHAPFSKSRVQLCHQGKLNVLSNAFHQVTASIMCVKVAVAFVNANDITLTESGP